MACRYGVGVGTFGSLPGHEPGNGAYLANAGEDVQTVGSVAPIIEGYVGCIVIRPDGSRYLARAVPDPLAAQQPD